MKKVLVYTLISLIGITLTGCDFLQEEEHVNEAPVITGSEYLTFDIFSEEPDWKDYITVEDEEDGVIRIEDSMFDTSDVDFTVEGIFIVDVYVEDSDGKTSLFSIEVEIIDSEASTIDTNEDELLSLPDVITMDIVDDYLGRSDVQYIDLRNLDERMKAGYIQGFEAIPYFDYLKYQGILNDANGDWIYDSGEIGSQVSLLEMFNKDKTIFLMCGSGVRANYVMEALLSLGYENVINIGGFYTYLETDKENLVLGGDSWAINLDVKGDYTPGTYVGFDEETGYFVYLVINNEGGIGSVLFDAITCSTDTDDDGIKDSDCTTKQILGDEYNMALYGGANQEWYLQANELAEVIVANQGWNNTWVIVDDYFEMIDDFAGVTISVDGFLAAWLEAIELAD